MTALNTLIGTAEGNDQLIGSNDTDQAQGLAGNDVISGNAGDDALYGDYASLDALNAVINGMAGTTMEAFGATSDWDYAQTDDGHGQMTQMIETTPGGQYTLTLDLAANMAGGSAQSAVNIIWDGEVIETVDLSSGAFTTHTVTLDGIDGPGALTLQTTDPVAVKGPVMNTDGPIYSYDHEVNVQGKDITVQAFAPGQSNVYQVLNGTLHLFDAETGTYTKAGSAATVNVNAIGYNAEDNLIYGIASQPGTDALGNRVESADLVMLDAQGNSYGMGSTPYRSWTGDFDDKGNLWVFESSMDRVTIIDVDQLDADGNPVSQTFKFPANLVTDRAYDVAYNAETQSFYGIVRPSAEGQATVMLTIDVSLVQDGGEPTFTTTPITHTMIDGQMVDGVPLMTFGAAVLDGDGTLYVGGNSGDHDMNDATGRQGGIYEIVVDEQTGTANLVLVADAPGVGANDGAADPTAVGFVDAEVSEETILVRDISLTPVIADGFDDTLSGGAGHDTLDGSIGSDELVGDSQGDTLSGGEGSDVLFGGAGLGALIQDIVSKYDDDGNRYDQFGNLLPEDDDVLFGGAGDDSLNGSAGHDTLDGGHGEDVLNGGSGFDVLYGAEGDDVLSGGADQDELHGGDGVDALDGGSGHDTLSGGTGADSLKGGSGNDNLSGDTGSDVLNGGSGADALFGGFGEDTLEAGSGNDILDGGAGADVLEGQSGNDDLSGGEGRDVMKGGSGNDTLSGGADRDTMNGGSGNDVLSGDDGNDYLNGAKGDDTLDGGAGNDRIVMGEGNDIATGGEGADTFIFKSEDTRGGSDVITDFDVSEDMLNFAALGLTEGDMTAKDWVNANVTMSDDEALITLGNTELSLQFTGTTQAADLFDTMVF